MISTSTSERKESRFRVEEQGSIIARRYLQYLEQDIHLITEVPHQDCKLCYHEACHSF
jgi:hypothetical protein